MNKAGFKICLSLYLAAVIFLCAIIGYIPAVTANAATQDSYYSDITATSGTQLLGQLHDLITTTHDTYTSYDDCKDPSIIKKTDAGSNSNSVMEFYSQADISSTWGSGAVGTWNREHVWCQSLSNGMWGKNSTAAAGGLSAADAWIKYQESIGQGGYDDYYGSGGTDYSGLMSYSDYLKRVGGDDYQAAVQKASCVPMRWN